jgi:hypothetical protein
MARVALDHVCQAEEPWLARMDVTKFFRQIAGPWAADAEGDMTQASTTDIPREIARTCPRADTFLKPMGLLGLLFVAVALLVFTYELTPSDGSHIGAPFSWTDAQRDTLFALMLGAATLGVIAFGLMRRRGRPKTSILRKLGLPLLICLTFGAGLAYFYGANGARRIYPHLHDSYHYLLGPKYYAELGYDALYACTAQALSARQVPDAARVRNLATDEMTTAAKLRSGPQCVERFSAERWDAFRRDLSVFTRAYPRLMPGVLEDRGYNGSPTHSTIASSLANAFTLSYEALSISTLIDVFSLCVMLGVLCYAFGLPLGLLCALLFFCQFPDRHLIIGGSFLRYQWLAALGVGVAMLKCKRYGAAGAAIATSAWLNVFPALFALPMLIKTLTSLVKTRALPETLRKFWLGALAASVLCFAVGASGAQGVQNYADFAEAMRVHNAAGRAPGFGVGIKYNFLRSNPETGGSARLKGARLKELRPVVVVSAALVLGWMLLLLRRLDDVEAAILSGFTGLFCIFGPTGYYYAFAAFLILLWHRRAWDSGGIAMLSLLFTASIPPYVAILSGAHRFYVFNRVVSASWTVYLICALGYLTWLDVRASRQAKDKREPQHVK